MMEFDKMVDKMTKQLEGIGKTSVLDRMVVLNVGSKRRAVKVSEITDVVELESVCEIFSKNGSFITTEPFDEIMQAIGVSGLPK